MYGFTCMNPLSHNKQLKRGGTSVPQQTTQMKEGQRPTPNKMWVRDPHNHYKQLKAKEGSVHLKCLDHLTARCPSAQPVTGRLPDVAPELHPALQPLNAPLPTHPSPCTTVSGDSSPFEAGSEAPPCVTERAPWNCPGSVFQLALRS